MRIALLTARFFPSLGGSEIVVDALAREYVKKGHQVFVICPGKFFKSYQEDESLPYKVLRHPYYFSKTNFLEKRFEFLKNADKTYCFDLVHAQAAFPESYLAARLKKERGVKFIFTSHGADIFSDYRLYRSKKIKELASEALSQTDLFCALNKELEDGFREFVGKDGDGLKIAKVSNGINLNDFKKSYRKELGEDYILYLGRLCQRKGVEVLIRAYAKLASRGNSVKLVIAGFGKERRNLEKLVSEYGLKNRVCFYGEVFGERKFSLLEHAKLVVIPTLSWEACSLVALEALAAGKWIIASDVSGIRHLVGKDDGELVEPGNVEALRDAMLRCLAKSRLNNCRGRALSLPASKSCFSGEDGASLLHSVDLFTEYGRSLSQISWQEIAKNYLQLYEQI